MRALLPLLALTGGAGVALLLARFNTFRTGTLADRLAPHVGNATTAQPIANRGVVDLGRELAVDIAARVGDVLGNAHATDEHLARTGETDIGTFRSRQLAAGLATFVGATGVAVIAPLPTVLELLGAVLAPAIVVAIIEQRLAERSVAIQRRAQLELPVVCEQLGMLLSAGYSLSSAFNRIASRSDGVIAMGLGAVMAETRHGASITDATRRWATRIDIGGLHRLAGLIDMNHEAADLGSLISAEARLARAELHRRQLELIERRAQQVWVPVTVATLIPGVMFIAVPFISAMAQLTG